MDDHIKHTAGSNWPLNSQPIQHLFNMAKMLMLVSVFSAMGPVLDPTVSDLYWDAGLNPVLAQIPVSSDVAVVGGTAQQKDDRQEIVSTWNGAETEHDKNPPLERAPGPKERH